MDSALPSSIPTVESTLPFGDSSQSAKSSFTATDTNTGRGDTIAAAVATPTISSNAIAGPSQTTQPQRTHAIKAGTDTGSNSNTPKQKSRTSRACSSCNRQKLRCDGQHPCHRCIALKVQDTCEYLPSLRGKTRKRKHSQADGSDKRSKDDEGAGDDDEGSSTSPNRPPGGPHQLLPHEMDSNMAMWKRDASLSHKGPAISALWGLEPPPKNPITQPPKPPGAPVPLPGTSPGSSANGGRRQVTEKLTTLPLPGDSHNPLAVLAEASATANSEHDPKSPKDSVKSRQAGEEAYYAPLERIIKDEAPHIMSFIKVHEAEQLFEMYFRYLHPHLPFLDKEHSPPSAVARRNNFLFNAICCVAARAFNIVLWERLKDFARFEMERLPKDKNIDVVQGHLVYAMWNLIRPKHFEQDMSWLRVGVAIRTAMDINLHRVALVRQARDGLPTWMLRSIIRTWLLGYIIDRTLSAQLGKPGSLSAENATARYQKLLLEGDERPTEDDVWVSCLAEWAQVLVRAIDMFRAEAANQHLEDSAVLTNQNSLPSMVRVFDKQFRQWREASETKAKQFGSDERIVKFMIGSIRLYDHYARLVVHSHGLQRAIDRSPFDLPASFAEYQTAAIRLITGFETDLESPGLTRGCPDFVFTVLTYAAVSLLKATDEMYAHLDPHRPTIFSLSRKAGDMLARAAMTPDHLPASQSMFLSRLIEVKSSEKTLAPQEVEPIDFEAFGQSIDNDTSKTLWPPMPSPANGMTLPPPIPPPSRGSGSTVQDRDQNIMGNVNGLNNVMDLSGWAAAQNESFPVPGAALGLGAANFWQDQDIMFSQDSFWKSILDGAQTPANGMV